MFGREEKITNNDVLIDSVQSDEIAELKKEMAALKLKVSYLSIRDWPWLSDEAQVSLTEKLKYVYRNQDLVDFYMVAKASIIIFLRTAQIEVANLPPLSAAEHLATGAHKLTGLFSHVLGFTYIPFVSNALSLMSVLNSSFIDKVVNQLHANRLKVMVPDGSEEAISFVANNIVLNIIMAFEDKIISAEMISYASADRTKLGMAITDFCTEVEKLWQKGKVWVWPGLDDTPSSIYGQLGHAYAMAVLAAIMADIKNCKYKDFFPHGPTRLGSCNFVNFLNLFDEGFKVENFNNIVSSKLNRASMLAASPAGVIESKPVADLMASEDALFTRTISFEEAVKWIDELARANNRPIKTQLFWYHCCSKISIMDVLEQHSLDHSPVSGEALCAVLEELALNTDESRAQLRIKLRETSVAEGRHPDLAAGLTGAAKEETLEVTTEG